MRGNADAIALKLACHDPAMHRRLVPGGQQARAVFDAVEQGRLQAHSRLHVRNRFLSAADGRPYRVDPGRDSNAEVHAMTGRSLQVRELARHMIATSSNLATNLLIDLIGLPEI